MRIDCSPLEISIHFPNECHWQSTILVDKPIDSRLRVNSAIYVEIFVIQIYHWGDTLHLIVHIS